MKSVLITRCEILNITQSYCKTPRLDKTATNILWQRINLTLTIQGCSQSIAHIDCAIYSNKLRHLLFQNYCGITVILGVICTIFLRKSVSCYSKKVAIYFEILAHPWAMRPPPLEKHVTWIGMSIKNIFHSEASIFRIYSAEAVSNLWTLWI